MSKSKSKSKFGSPLEVNFCKKCVESNQRFVSSAQHKMVEGEQKDTAMFDEEGVCLSCRYFERKEKFDWKTKEKELKDILDQYRSKDGSYDVVVPGSGGKDSIWASIVLKEKYKMNPITVTWAPGLYTDVGWKNYNSWISYGFDNYLFTANKKIHGLLTRLAFLNLLHPFQPFVLGQNSFSCKFAHLRGIKLVIYGDGMAEKFIGKINEVDLKDKKDHKIMKHHYAQDNEKIFLGGLEVAEIKEKYKISQSDLNPFLPIRNSEIKQINLKILHITDFLDYNPQKNYYFAKEKTGFEVNPDGRSEGTYTKYQSLDDKLDGLHHYTWFIKSGRGRATEDAALEVRNKIITRKEAISLVKKYDGEFPKKYFQDCLEHMNITEKQFFDKIDEYRLPHLWEKQKGKWKLKHAVWHEKN